MASRERPTSAFDTGHADDPPAPTTAELAEVAEAEAAAAEAEALAAAARARAMRLRWEAAGGVDGPVAPTTTRWRPRPGTVAVTAAIILLCVSLSASGFLLRHHHVVSQEKQRTAQFAAAARQAVATLMSLDFSKTDQDMQHIAGISTGRFRDGFPALADELTKRLHAKQVVTKATVNEVAVESLTGDSAVVLVAATTEVTEPKAPDAAAQPLRPWHIALRLTMDGGQPKMSSIELIE